MFSMRSVYLDHAAATPLDLRAREVMLPFLDELYSNPSSFHSAGKAVKDAMDEARQSVAKILGTRADEIIFTSGGTESNNLAILGFSHAIKASIKNPQIIISTIEHPSVIETVKYLQEKEGFSVTYLSVDARGMVRPDDLKDALTPQTVLVSIMYANNEIGTIQPIAELGKIIQKFRASLPMSNCQLPVFHTDACQASGVLELNIEKLHVDMLTLNGSKIYGPKGAGVLYVKRGIKLQPLQFGGSQEKTLRPGTENVAGIIGLAKALELAQTERQAEARRLVPLRDKLIAGILKLPKTRLNGHPTERLPNNVNISFMDIEGEALILYLDAQGVYASTGSACTSASLEPSHVILALGLPYEVAHGSIRFSLGRSTIEEDIDYVLKILPPLVEKLRSISPVRVDEKYYVR